MKPITEQWQQHLIAHCKVIMSVKSKGSPEYFIAEIALASLTAVPVMAGKELYDAITDIQNRVMSSCGRYAALRCQTGIGDENMSPIYTALPVPVIKMPETKERLSSVQCTAEIYLQGRGDGYNECIDDIRRLNGMGE